MSAACPGIDWWSPDTIPALLITAVVPLRLSIAAGIGFGIIGYVVLMVVLGRTREIHPLMWVDPGRRLSSPDDS
jgi:AGZA family xanthine/uracil permease-like MFS transporter